MKRFIPREKLGKKARKQLDNEQRATWAFSPVTKKVESKNSTTARENRMTVTMITAWGFLYMCNIGHDILFPQNAHNMPL